MELLPRLLHRTVHQARVLRALVAVHEGGDVPGVAVAEGTGLAQRHVVLDEGGRGVDAVHARAPVERLRAPQRWEHRLPQSHLALAVGAVADRALRGIDLGAALDAVAAFRRGHVRIAASGQADPGRRLARQPIGVDGQGLDLRAVGRRHLAVHAELEAALQALGERIDLVVLGAERRIDRVGRPLRRGVGPAALVEMAVDAVELVTDQMRRVLPGFHEQRLALADHFAEGVVREAAFRRRLERLRGRRCRVDGSDQQAGDGQGKDRRHVHGWPPA